MSPEKTKQQNKKPQTFRFIVSADFHGVNTSTIGISSYQWSWLTKFLDTLIISFYRLMGVGWVYHTNERKWAQVKLATIREVGKFYVFSNLLGLNS